MPLRRAHGFDPHFPLGMGNRGVAQPQIRTVQLGSLPSIRRHPSLPG